MSILIIAYNLHKPIKSAQHKCEQKLDGAIGVDVVSDGQSFVEVVKDAGCNTLTGTSSRHDHLLKSNSSRDILRLPLGSALRPFSRKASIMS